MNRNPHPEGSLGQNLEEDVIDRQITALMRENELLGQHNARLHSASRNWRAPPAPHRAGVLGELTFRLHRHRPRQERVRPGLAVLDEWKPRRRRAVRRKRHAYENAFRKWAEKRG